MSDRGEVPMADQRGVLRHWDWQSAALILSAAAVVAYSFFFLIDIPAFDQRTKMHDSIIAGTALSPFRYRVLVPFLMEGVIRLFRLGLPYRQSIHAAYLLYEIGAVCFSLNALYLLCREWFSKSTALVGVLFVAAVIPVALRDHVYQPWSLLEFGFVALGMLLVLHQKGLAFAAVVALASLNRETGLILALLFPLIEIDLIGLVKRHIPFPARQLLLSTGYALIWGVIYLALRMGRGQAPLIDSYALILTENLSLTKMRWILANNALFLGAGWFFALLGFKKSPAAVRRAAGIIVPYLGLMLVFTRWWEVRLWMTLYPVLIPMMLAYLFSVEAPTTGPAQSPADR